MKHSTSHLQQSLILCFCVLGLGACGGGSSSSSSNSSASNTGNTGNTGTTYTLTGVVIENTGVSGASGATVCLSSSATLTCDSNSTPVPIGDSGKYTLTGIVINPTAQLVANIPTYTDPVSQKSIAAHQLATSFSVTSSGGVSLQAMNVHAKSSAIPQAQRKSASPSSFTINISPLTTLIAQQVYALGISPTAAASTIASLVGNGITAQQLTADYTTTGNNNQFLQNLGITAAYQFGVISGQVAAALGTTPNLTQIKDATLLAASTIESNLTPITQKLTGLTTPVDPSKITVSSTPITPSNVTAVLAQANTAAQPLNSSIISTLNGTYSVGMVLDSSSSSTSSQPAYLSNSINSQGDGTTAAYVYSPTQNKFVASTTSSSSPSLPPIPGETLIGTTWVPDSSLLLDTAFIGNGLDLQNFIVSSSNNTNSIAEGATIGNQVVYGSGIPVTLSSIDLGGQSEFNVLSTYLASATNTGTGPGTTLTNAFNITSTSTNTFPSGSTAYSIAIPSNATLPVMNMLFYDAGNQALVNGTLSSTPVTSTSLAALISTFANGSGNQLYLYSNFSSTSTSITSTTPVTSVYLQFGPTTNNSGSFTINSYSGSPTTASPFTPSNSSQVYTGTYTISTGTPQILTLTLPTSIVSLISQLPALSPFGNASVSPIFSVSSTGTVFFGASFSNYQSKFNTTPLLFLNTTALNALKANVCPISTPNC